MPAELFMSRLRAPGRRLLLIGTGALVASCLERAEGSADEIFWLPGPAGIGRCAPPSLRYDHLFVLASGGPLHADRDDFSIQEIVPASSKVRVWDEGRLLAVKPHAAGGVEATVSVDSTRTEQVLVDQVVISASSQNEPHEDGSVFPLVKGLSLRAIIHTSGPLAGVPLGLETAEGDVRVLGAAAMRIPEMADANRASTNSVVHYERSLPRQAQVMGLGITLSGALVAQANRFFAVRLNRNANIAHESELAASIGSGAFTLVANRKLQAPPFIDPARLPAPLELIYGRPADYAVGR